MATLSLLTVGSLCPVLIKLLPFSTVSKHLTLYTILRQSIPHSISRFRRSLRRFVHERAPLPPPLRPPKARNQLT
eukprot:4305296-Pleurochrysis_carterae.AAC.1